MYNDLLVLSPEVVGGQYALSSITERHWTSNFINCKKQIIKEREREKKKRKEREKVLKKKKKILLVETTVLLPSLRSKPFEFPE